VKLYFITSNRHKFREAKSILKGCGIKIEPLNLKIEEIRSENCREVAEVAAGLAFAKLRRPLFVEDAGLFINALDGFPGALSSWVFGKIGNRGMLRLMEGKKDRHARFVSAVAYRDARIARSFTGECKGSIAEKAAGSGGFGYDQIFIPAGFSKTFSQDAGMKAEVSHRRRALENFARWYLLYREAK